MRDFTFRDFFCKIVKYLRNGEGCIGTLVSLGLIMLSQQLVTLGLPAPVC